MSAETSLTPQAPHCLDRLCETNPPLNYMPKPIDTRHVHLDTQLQPLVQRLTESFHDVWAQSRIAAGWRYGPQRDDSKKMHPCLVPFEELGEAERDFDERSVTELLRAILALGCRIEIPDDLYN